MNTKAIFTIVAIVAAIGMLGMAAVATSVHQAYAKPGGVPDSHADGNKAWAKCQPPAGIGLQQGNGKIGNNGEPCSG